MSAHSGRFHIAMIVVVLAVIAGPGCAATADPASPVKIEKTPAQKEHEAHAAALQAIHDAVEASIAHHPEISAELKAQLRQPSLHETWVKSVNDAAKKALESTPLLKGVEVTDAMKADFKDRHSYMVNGRDVSKEEHDRVKAQIQGLADDMANQMGPQRR